MGLFEGRQRKEWRAALDTAREAGAVGNVTQAERSLRVALALRSAVPSAWLDDFRSLTTDFEDRFRYAASSGTFAALRAEASIDPALGERWHSELDTAKSLAEALGRDSEWKSGGPSDRTEASSDLEAVLQALQSALDLGTAIPWEMQIADFPPVWAAFMQAARVTLERGYGFTSLRVLRAALPTAEALSRSSSAALAEETMTSPTCKKQLADTAFSLAGMTPYEELRRDFLALSSRAATSVAEPTPMLSPQVSRDFAKPARVEPARVEPARVEPARVEPARVEPARVEPARVDPASAELDSLLDALGWSISQGDRGAAWQLMQSVELLRSSATPLQQREINRLGQGLGIRPSRQLDLGEPPKIWDPGGAGRVRIRWAAQIRQPQLVCAAITHEGLPSLIVGEPPRGPGPKLMKSAIELSAGSLEECVDWGLRILNDRSLCVDLVDEAQAWSPTTTREQIGEFAAGGQLPPDVIADALPGSDDLRLPIRPEDYLRLANRLEELVVGGHPLDLSAKTVLREFLVGAPLTVGTWASFKAILKALEAQASELPVALGAALARITCLPSDRSLPGTDALSVVIPGETGGRKTLAYLDRRGRRVLRTLSWRDPTAYAAVVPAFLGVVDSLLANGDTINHRHTFDFVLYGGVRPDSFHQRFPDSPPMPQRHRQRWDPARNTWRGNSAQVASLLAHTTISSDIATWAFQVLSELGESIPDIHTVPALLSGNLDLQQRGEAAAVGNPIAAPSWPTTARIAALKTAIPWGDVRGLTAVADGLSLAQLVDLREGFARQAHRGNLSWLDDTIVQMAHSAHWQAYRLADGWVDLPDPELSALGWRLASLYYQDDDSNFLTFVQRHGGSPTAVARSVTRLAASGSVSQAAVVLGWCARTSDRKSWRDSVAVVDRALAASPQVWPHLWSLLGEGVDPSTAERVRELPSLAQGIVESTAPSSVATLDERQTDALWSFLTAHPQRFAADDEFALAVTLVPNAALCSTAISILRSQNRIKDLWLPLIESGLPPAVQAGDLYLRSVTTRESLGAAVLDLLDSDNSDARHLAMALLSDNGAGLSWADVLDEMTEHRDPSIWREVAQRLESLDDRAKRESFEREVLTTRRRGRSAKTLVQQHLDSPDKAEHVAGLLDVVLPLAHGAVPRDKEWALGQLVTLSESGQPIPGLTVIEEAG